MLIPSAIYRKGCKNMELTNEEETKIGRAMGGTSNKLRVVESEAAHLRDRLAILSQRKKDTENFIKVHQGLLSSIRRLLPEILQEIFCLCLPIAHNSVLSFKDAPLLFGRVCNQWRQIAYSTPALWSSLHINIVPLSSSRARARLETVDAWLSRSGILPLSISMSASAATFIAPNMFVHEFRPYFTLVEKYVRRWKYIHFRAEDWDPMCFLTEINADDLPLLEVFHIQGGNPTTSSYLKKKSGILSAPLLRDVSAHPYSLRLFSLPLNWSNLTGLDSSLSNLSDTFKLLSLCSNLEACTLRGGLSFSQSSDSWFKIVLPKLRTLIIRGVEPSHNNDLLIILNNLLAPALRHLSCQLSNWSPPASPDSPLPEALLASEVFSSFLQRLNEPLEELDLRAYYGKASYLMELLYLCPGLKRLSLRSSRHFGGFETLAEGLLNDHLLLGFIPFERRIHCHSCSLVKEPEGEQVEVHDLVLPSSTCLCPNLDVLDVTGAGWSKHILLEFLRSRLVDYDKYDIARLDRLRILSYEPRSEDDDLKVEIDTLAAKSGLLVKLELHSPVPAPILPPPHSDSFGEELLVF